MTEDSDQWDKHFYKVDRNEESFEEPPEGDEKKHARVIEPWLTALFQSEHVNLLMGSGFMEAACNLSGVDSVDMSKNEFDLDEDISNSIDDDARATAKEMKRGAPNIEDQFRSAIELLRGLEIAGNGKASALRDELNRQFKDFLTGIGQTERRLVEAWDDDEQLASVATSYLVSFLMSFATRSPSKQRLHVFTTNYDRLIEHVCDRAGLRLLDRFVGALSPEFRTNRVDVDMHYDPPGIRGEPRYLEGVIRLTKLHGSIDWRERNDRIRQETLGFGSQHLLNSVPDNPLESTIVFPNSSKGVETAYYPYAELFRDFSSALCRPNSVLVTYGYGFGDSHINRVLREMLQIPSTHLVIISWDKANGRIRKFYDNISRPEQISVLLGNHFGDLENLQEHYLPKPNIDRVSIKKRELLQRRNIGSPDNSFEEPDSVDDALDAEGS